MAQFLANLPPRLFYLIPRYNMRGIDYRARRERISVSGFSPFPLLTFIEYKPRLEAGVGQRLTQFIRTDLPSKAISLDSFQKQNGTG